MTLPTPSESLADRRARAASRCDAKLPVWEAVHREHADRRRVTVELTDGRRWFDTEIVGISDDGFTIASPGVSWRTSFRWPDVAAVVPVAAGCTRRAAEGERS